MLRLIIPPLIAVVFYILIPGWGAFHVRNMWRGFRKRIIQASLTPFLDNDRYSHERLVQSSSHADGYLGNFRFIGKLEAMQGDVIWLKNNRLSVSANLRDCEIYSIPSLIKLPEDTETKKNEDVLPDETPERMAWERMFSLPEGAQMFIAGPLYSEKGQIVFRNGESKALTVILYDGPDESLFGRVIWGSRQKNEYWNQYTPVSLSAGAFALFILAYTYLRSPALNFTAIFTLTLCLVPIVILLPPGVFFYFIYKNLWKRSRILRAERDIARLPAQFFPETLRGVAAMVTLPNGEAYGWRAMEGIGSAPSGLTIPEPVSFCAGAAKLRSCTVSEKGPSAQVYYIFGRPIQGTDGTMRMEKPEDPMAEHIVLPGNPKELSLTCARKARLFEVLAMTSFFIGLIGNSVLAFILLSILIR